MRILDLGSGTSVSWSATSTTQVGPATLQQRLEEELAGGSAVFAHPILVSAWGRPG